MPNMYIRDYDWANSKVRSIDDATLVDLLKIVQYQAGRMSALEGIGISDNAGAEDALFMYVLDALGVPPEGAEKQFKGDHNRFERVCKFSREWFEELFYQEFLLNNNAHGWSAEDVIKMFKEEASSGELREHYR